MILVSFDAIPPRTGIPPSPVNHGLAFRSAAPGPQEPCPHPLRRGADLDAPWILACAGLVAAWALADRGSRPTIGVGAVLRPRYMPRSRARYGARRPLRSRSPGHDPSEFRDFPEMCAGPSRLRARLRASRSFGEEVAHRTGTRCADPPLQISEESRASEAQAESQRDS
jgi:hypothetical protein